MSRLSESKVGGFKVNVSQGLMMNDSTIREDVVVPTGKNATSTGPITIVTGKTVTIATGQNWTIL